MLYPGLGGGDVKVVFRFEGCVEGGDGDRVEGDARWRDGSSHGDGDDSLGGNAIGGFVAADGCGLAVCDCYDAWGSGFAAVGGIGGLRVVAGDAVGVDCSDSLNGYREDKDFG